MSEIKKIEERLIEAEKCDGHLQRGDCWTLLNEVKKLRKGITKVKKMRWIALPARYCDALEGLFKLVEES